MTVEQKANEAHEANRALAPKYHIPYNCWIDWFSLGYRRAEKEYVETGDIDILKDQVESLKAALVAKDETHKLEIRQLKTKALNAFLECEGYDEFEMEINKFKQSKS